MLINISLEHSQTAGRCPSGDASCMSQEISQERTWFSDEFQKVLLVDPHSHFNHLFAFPRFAVLPDYEVSILQSV